MKTLILLFCALPLLALEGLGTFSLDLRTRYETAEQDGKRDADNLSLRLRPSFTSKDVSGFQFMIGGEFTEVADRDDYNAAGVHGDPTRAAIADPENAELDQAWISYTDERFNLKVGRQLITHDGHRWIGHVGWRQNRQTFDAVSLGLNPAENLTLSYSYVGRVNRIFGDEAPGAGANARDFDSDSHLLHLNYVADFATLSAYAYALDLDDAPGKIAGSNTVGISAAKTFSDPFSLYLEYARQTDAADNPQDYAANYLHARLSGNLGDFSYELGFEQLEADAVDGGHASVKAPLATLHKFNGFADVFLVTPDEGLEDAYVMLGYRCELGALGPLTTKLWYHDFRAHKGGDLGQEFDAVVVKPLSIPKLPGKLALLAKFADYQAPSGGADVRRTSVEFNYAISF